MPHPCLETRGDSVLLRLRVVPNAKRDQLSVEPEQIRLRVRAPAVEGAANKAVITTLSQLLGLRAKQVSLVRGHTSRSKQLSIEGVSLTEVDAILRRQ